MDHVVPGGYNFIFAVFWTVVCMIAVGTTIVPIILSIGLAIMGMETVGKGGSAPTGSES